MTTLPGAASPIVEEIKVRRYLLSAEHPQNGGKAAFFRAFGFDAAAWTAMRDALVNACVDTKWSDAVRRCMVDSRDHLAFALCQQQLTDPQRQAIERSTSP